MTEPSQTNAGLPLDVAVRDAWRELKAGQVDRPQTLVLLGTGLGLLPERLSDASEIALGELAGVPREWRDAMLWSGELAGHRVWLLEDAAGEPRDSAPRSPWERAFPVWLATVAGARLMVHASAGASLATDRPFPLGSFALASDHLNLSGGTPLHGLGESTLGPLFPDVSRLHHQRLRAAALQRAEALGLDAREAVVACTPGPSVETPAERAFFARAGADVCVQGLASPLLAAAHAGLVGLAIVAVCDQDTESTRLKEIVAAAGPAEAALEDLLVALAGDLDAAYAELEARE